MKQTKKLFALLLIICMVLAMVPAVSAETAEDGTVTYNLSYQSAIDDYKEQGYDVDLGSNGFLVDAFIQNINKYHSEGYFNWNYAGHSDGVTATGGTNAGFHPNGWFRNRGGVGTWVAVYIDNPGEGMWKLSANIPQTKYGSPEINMYILPTSAVKSESTVTADIETAIAATDPTTVFNCYKNRGAADAVADHITQGVILTDPKDTTKQATWIAGDADQYILVLKTMAIQSGRSAAYMYISQLMMTPVLATVEDGETATDYTDADALATAIENAKSGTEITLLSDITVSDFTLNSGVKLNLNGKTLNATVNDAAGEIIDSSLGAGRVKGATLGNIAADQMVLTDKDGYRHICDYTLSLPTAFDAVEAAEDGDSVRFWFNVRFENAAAYDVIAAGNSGFSVGANFQWNDNTPVGAKFGTDLSVEDWASKMKSNPNYSFYVDVTGLKNAAANGTLTVLPTVSGDQGSSSITSGLTHTVSAAQ